jgi:glucose/mannose-6-phosphate isomerase
MEVDKSNFRQVILDSIKQFDADLDFFNQFQLRRRSFDKIIFCGMGGSALVGNIVLFFEENGYKSLIPKLPLIVHRSYSLPSYADQNSLIICSSYSGQTEETISAYQKAKENDLEVACLTCGGQLAQLCEQNKTPWVKILSTLQPRASLGYQLSAIIKILMAYGLLDQSAKNELPGLSKIIFPAQIENEAKNLCVNLRNKTPIIYSSKENQVLAQIWKIKFNENTKIPAFWNYFPELNHNEMVGWTSTFGHFHFLFLLDDSDLPRIKQRMKITAELLAQKGLSVDFIKISGGTIPEKLFRAIVFGDWLSFHLAIFYGIDPNPVEMVEEFKKKLKE